jgi:putative addiction module component (TIGR02574 family)
MAQDTSELRKELDKLTPKQKAELARTLIDSLDEDLDENVEQLWLDEAARRYEAYRRGEMSSRPAVEVFARVRARLRR